MGNWNINIQGIGCHHNKDNPTDANRMTEEFVHELLKAGHAIEWAAFTHGSLDRLLPPTFDHLPDGRTPEQADAQAK